MISKKEINSFALKYRVEQNTIEKDYILNWLLAGIANSDTIRENWVFKGGTCLKKCFFEEYRFSEDLDFTIRDKSHINGSFLMVEFEKISEWIYERSGVEILKEHLRFEEYKNPRGEISVAGRVAYRGPMQRRGNNPTIKLDLSHDEILVNKPTLRSIHHPYSDGGNNMVKIQTYCIEEIFSEKLRALVQRSSPRDLYDVIHLHEDQRWEPDRKLVQKILKEKCDFKKVAIPTMQIIESLGTQNDLAYDWDKMLRHQIESLEPWEKYWNRLPAVFAWLHEEGVAHPTSN